LKSSTNPSPTIQLSCRKIELHNQLHFRGVIPKACMKKFNKRFANCKNSQSALNRKKSGNQNSKIRKHIKTMLL